MQIFSPPCQVAHEEFSRRLRVNFKFYVLVYHTICVMVGFYLLNAANVFNFSIGNCSTMKYFR